MAQYDRQIATALRLIAKYGQIATWRQIVDGVPDPETPWLPVGSAPVDYSPHICFLPLDRDGKEFLMSIGQTEAVSGSMYGLMGNVAFVPNIRDTVIRDGVSLEIKSIDLLSPNGQKILYTMIFNG